MTAVADVRDLAGTRRIVAGAVAEFGAQPVADLSAVNEVDAESGGGQL